MDWKQLFKENVLNGGKDYVQNHSVHNLTSDGGTLSADVEGLESFRVRIRLGSDTVESMECGCSYAQTGSNCKHMAAVLFAWEEMKVDEEAEQEKEEKKEFSNDSTSNNTQNIKPDSNTIANARNNITLSVDMDEVINYAIQQNGVNIISEVCVKNNSKDEFNNLILRIESDSELIEKSEVGIQKLRPEEEVHLKNIKLKINGDYLASLIERIVCSVHFQLIFENQEIISDTKEVTALAFEQWPGLKYTPELLAAFSMPNHPVVSSLLQLASKYLEKWTKDPSLAGYQYDDPNRVKQMAAAAYAAIQQKNITYANPPSSFEVLGQRIRLADAVLEQHMGTCMDLTLLYVACLEAMGLNPIMVLIHGHIFAGVWLIEDSFSNTIMDDPSQLEKRMSNGIHELLVVECTAMCAGKNIDFDHAVKLATDNVSNYGKFEFAIDVVRARSMGIRPLPVRVKTDGGFVVQHQDRNESNVTSAPSQIGKTFDLSNLGEKTETTKQLQWERKLLDLSMRNMLINLRFTKAVVPLLSSNISILEDALSDGEEFQVLPRPDNMEIKGEGIPVEALTDLGSFTEFMELESKHKKLHSFYTEKELSNCLTKMYRSAKTSLEENGASTLYLALGLLRWTEGKKTENVNVRYAPIILLPIDITRKSANKGYTMRMRDEDAQINITLLEFLKQNYDIQINGLSPLPTDDHGLDLPKIFAIMRHGIMSLPMWDVLEAGFIGNFSFSQFVMWNDIHSHSDMLERNDIVRSLIKGAVDWDCKIPDNVDTDEAYLPITVDASQLRAINMAANNVSFVLHGPPGTGKSQTITAMIANALTKGKTVLFVAEKMAALEVVQKRLEALGIGDFCLELHSNKATKKAVLDQLRKNLEIGVLGLRTEYDQKIDSIRQMKADLDAYVQKLHERRGFGKSVKELIDLYEEIPDYSLEVRFSPDYVATLSQGDLDNQKRLLEQLVATGNAIGHPNGHPLSMVGQTVYSQTLKMELEESVGAYKQALISLPDQAEKLLLQLSLEQPHTEQEWDELYRCAQSIVSAENIPAIILAADNVDKEFDEPIAYVAARDTWSVKKEQLCRNWQEVFLHQDMNAYQTKYDEANKKFLGKGRALKNLVDEIQSFSNTPVQIEQIPAIIAGVRVYQQEEKILEDKNAKISYEWKQIVDAHPSERELCEYKQQVKEQLSIVAKYFYKIRQLENQGKFSDCMANAKLFIQTFETVKEKESVVVQLLKLHFNTSTDNWIEDRMTVCEQLTQHAAVIKDWIVFKQFEELCINAGLEPICNAYENGLDHEKVMDVYLRSMYKAIILQVIESEPVLNGFTGNGFNEQIVQFKKLDDEFTELTKEEMYYKLTHNLPLSYDNVEISKELNILRRAISSNGRGLSIRTLFDQIPHVLSRLTPCMLMSPISVAQYLSADGNPYDIVIFDEASQLPTCKAVGVLARGKNAVIVGDPNQMPPTSFFAGNTVDEDNLDIEDLDSILDDCLALGMPSAYLKWHYRSRHESLIAFSNHEFYENSMLTFPSVNDREKRVSMVKAEGFFDRKKGRINEGEAKAIIKEIKRRYKDDTLKNQSIGVVTFNISQQTLIEDMLQEEFANDIEFDKWATTGAEALFVKNLENVQGDERDVILFSVAFGPDEDGKLSLNFGPLNREGGWKRLNVAVSRARSEMIVFTIMTSEMIDLKRTKAKGVESLKDFLEFAEKGKLQLSYAELHAKTNQGILKRVCAEIEKAGYKYQKAVGHSKFKVDIAVLNPYNEEEYLLGIMLDGESYRQSKNTKDREIAQINVLGGLGWSLHRIWTMDWWDNKQKEIQKLLDELEQKKQIAYENAKEAGILTTPDDTSDTNQEGILEQGDDTELTKDVEQADLSEEDSTTSEAVISEQESVLTEVVSEEKNTVVSAKLENHTIYSSTVKIAGVVEKEPAITEKVEDEETHRANMEYRVVPYDMGEIAVTPLSTQEYVLKGNASEITRKAQMIIEAEAPICHERLVRRVLRSFDIQRASTQTTEATEKALKKVQAKSMKQNGVKYYWSSTQEPEQFDIYRNDTELSEKRSMDEVCLQELKNAVCVTLDTKGAATKDDLVRDTIRTMGFARSGNALVEAVERGLKYGRKTGEIVQLENKKFALSK